MKKSTVAFGFLLSIFSFSLLAAPASKDKGYFISDRQKHKNSFTVNLRSLQKRLLESNMGVLRAAVGLHASKDQVGVARGNLLPSINVGAVLGSFANPAFSISSIEFLVPFLLPSRWFEYFAQKDIYRADKEAYVALQLNTFASAYSIYHLVLQDFAIREVLLAEVRDLQYLADLSQSRYSAGLGTVADLESAKAELNTAQLRLGAMNSALLKETLSLRKSLGFDVDTQLYFSEHSVPESNFEYKPVRDLVDRAYYLAPENYQLQYLQASAKNEKWAKVFSFLSSLTLSAKGPNFDFGNATGAASLNLGFGYLPSINVSSRKVEDVLLQQQDLKLEFSRAVETTQGQISIAKDDLDRANQALEQRTLVYQNLLANYQAGKSSMIEVLDSKHKYLEAAVSRVTAAGELSNLRIAFHRSMIGDAFSKIGFCKDPPEPERRGLFDRRTTGTAIQRPKLGVNEVYCNEQALVGR